VRTFSGNVSKAEKDKLLTTDGPVARGGGEYINYDADAVKAVRCVRGTVSEL
jgi:hypothetical protein